MADEDTTKEDVFEPVEEQPSSQASPDPEAVKAYLAEQKAKEEQQAAEGANQMLEDEPPAESPGQEEEQEDDQLQGTGRITFKADSSFEVNEMDLLEKQQVRVNLEDIPVTEADMRNYLKCMLQDVPLELDIELYGGKIIIRARAISAYEQQLAAATAYSYTMSQSNTHLASVIAPVFIQKLRIALQLRTFNGLPVSDLEFKPEPNMLVAHIKKLTLRADDLIGSCSAPRWNAYVYALNVFEHKLTKLNEMALNRDFLNPGD